MNTEILNSLSAAALVVAYNNLADHAERDEVKSFKNKTVGRDAVTEIFEAANKARAEHNLPLLVLNADGSLGVVEETSETSAETETPAETPAPAPVEAKSTAKPKSDKKPGRAPSIAPSDIIILKVANNPKRASAATRFSAYRTGITVAEYAAAVDSTAQATRDILWDKSKNWIEVVGAKSAKGKAARAELTAVKSSGDEAPEGESQATDDVPAVDPAAVQAPAAETGATA
jgi:hypothetical protein